MQKMREEFSFLLLPQRCCRAEEHWQVRTRRQLQFELIFSGTRLESKTCEPRLSCLVDRGFKPHSLHPTATQSREKLAQSREGGYTTTPFAENTPPRKNNPVPPLTPLTHPTGRGHTNTPCMRHTRALPLHPSEHPHTTAAPHKIVKTTQHCACA